MKKVKTYLFAILFIIASSVMGACSCGGPDISVVDLKITGTEGLVYSEENDEYMVMQGDSFTISYELLPNNATDNTVYLDVSVANRFESFGDSIIHSAKEDLEFVASKTNKGQVKITLTSKDGSKKSEIKVNVVAPSDLQILSVPQGLKYDTTANKFTWNEMTDATTGEPENIAGYRLSLNDGMGEEKIFDITEKVNGKFPTEVSYNLDNGVNYYAKVRALGNLVDKTYQSAYCDSIKFYCLPSPTNLKNNNGVLSWDYSVKDKITGYRITFGDNQVVNRNISPDATIFDMAGYLTERGIDLNTFNVSVMALNSDFENGGKDDAGIMNYILPSRFNPQVSISKLSAPSNLRFERLNDFDGSTKLSWNAVSGASGYEISIKEFATNNVVKSITHNVSNSIVLSDLTEGKYVVAITTKGDADKSIFGTKSTSYTNIVVLPLIKGNLNYSTNSLDLSKSSLNSLIGSENVENNLNFELFARSVTQSYEQGTKLVTDSSTSVDLTQFNFDTPYYVLVRPVGKTGGTITVDSREFNIVVSKFSDSDNSYSYTISQLSPARVESVSNLGVVTFVDSNTPNVGEAYKYKLLLLKNGTTSSQVVEEALVVTDPTDSTKKSINLLNVFVGQFADAGSYEIKVVPVSNQRIDASASPTATPYYTFTKLAKVSGITIGENDTITWDAVNGADHYVVKINNNDEVIVNDPIYTLTETLLDYNNVRITCIGNDQNTTNSDTALFENLQKAQKVNNVRVENGVLMWDGGITNSKFSIAITIPGMETSYTVVSENKFDGLSGIQFAETATIKITHIIASGTNQSFNSDPSDEIRLVRLNVVDESTFAVVNNSKEIEFKAVVNANTYVVTIKKGTFTKTFTLVSDLSLVDDNHVLYTTYTKTVEEEGVQYIKFNLPELASGTYSIRFQAVPANQSANSLTDSETGETYFEFNMISQRSDSANFVVYPEVSDISIHKNVTWNFNETLYLQNYLITFVGGAYAGKSFTTANTSLDFVSFMDGETETFIEAGTYTITIQAIAGVGNVVYATPTQAVVTKLEKPVLKVVDNQITFAWVENVDRVIIYQNGEVVNCTITTAGDESNKRVVVSGLNIESGMEYTYTAMLEASEGYVNSQVSDALTVKKADTPQNLKLQNSKLLWDNVQNNNGYIVILDETNNVVNSNEYTISGLIEPKAYTFMVYTVGGKVVDGVTLLNSDVKEITISRLATASSLAVNNNVLTWSYEGVSHPVKYKLVLEYYVAETDSWTEVELKEFDYLEGTNPEFNLSEITEYNGYKLKIACLGSDESCTLNGEYIYFNGMINGVETNTFERVATPTLTYDNGFLRVNHESDYGRYCLYYFDAEANKFVMFLDSMYSVSESYVVKLNSELNKSVTLAISVKAGGESGKIDSNISESLAIKKLSTITDFRIERNASAPINPDDVTTDYKGTFKWTSVDGAIAYRIYYRTAEVSQFDGEQFYTVEGGASNYVSFETIYTAKTLTQGQNYVFAIMAIGTSVAGTPVLYNLNNDLSSTVSVMCVSNVQDIRLKNGIINWTSVAGVNGYYLVVNNLDETETHPFNTVVTTTSFDLNALTSIRENHSYSASIIPISTESSNFAVLYPSDTSENNKVVATKIYFNRYSALTDFNITDGLLHITLQAPSVSDALGIKNAMTNYYNKVKEYKSDEEIPEDIVLDDADAQAEYIKYYGYVHLRVFITGYGYETINVPNNDFAVDVTTLKITCKYQLKLEVPSTQKLELKVCMMGNSGDNTSSSNSLPSFTKTLEAYKSMAPAKTKVDNLTTSDGYIAFTRILDGNGNFITKYSLKAVCETSVEMDDNKTLGTKINVNTLYADIETSGIISDTEATFVLLDASDLTKCYYQNKTQNFEYYYFNSSGEKIAWSHENEHRLLNNQKYTFTLTSFGTSTGDETVYLRSNPYQVVEITYLYDYSAFGYKYDINSTDGGYLTWHVNEKCLGYELYVISKDDVVKYGNYSPLSDGMNNSAWVKNTALEPYIKVYTINHEETTFMFYNTDLSAGYYWCAIRPIGNGTDFITAPTTSNTVEVYKLSKVSAKMQDGRFVWVADSSELNTNKIFGFKILIYTYKDGGRTQVVLPALIMTNDTNYYYMDGSTRYYFYEIPESLNIDGADYSFLGTSGEKYGIGVIAIGNNVNDGEQQCVCSTVFEVVNSGVGYERLPQVTGTLDTENAQLSWSYELGENVSEEMKTIYEKCTKMNSFSVYVNGIKQEGSFAGFQLNKFVYGGTYEINIVSNANNTVVVDENDKSIVLGGPYLNSIKSDTITIVKYYNPVVKVVDGVVTWKQDSMDNLKPMGTTITIVGEGDLSYINISRVLEEDIRSCEIDDFSESGEPYPSGYYTISVKYNAYVDENGVYHMESPVSTIRVFKLASPVVGDVELLDEDGNEKPRTTGFSGAVVWDVVDDGTGSGTHLEKYKIEIRIQTEEGTILRNTIMFDATTVIGIDRNKIYIKDSDAEYGDNFDLYYFEYNKLTNKIYMNITYSILEGFIGESISGKVIELHVCSVGNTPAGTEQAQVNSAVCKKILDFRTNAPANMSSASDIANGILRWSGSDNPVKVTFNYGKIRTVWLGSDYIKKYGRVYYLPYTSNVAYGNVTLEYILNNTSFSNVLTVNIGTINLFESGEGTSTNPYIIKPRNVDGTLDEQAEDVATQFVNIKYRPISYIKVDKDVSSINVGKWTMIEEFMGVLDGNASERNGQKLVLNNIQLQVPSDITINQVANVSMFNVVGSLATIKDISLKFATNIDTSIYGSGSGAIENDIIISGLTITNRGLINNVDIIGSNGEYIKAYTKKEVIFSGIATYNYGEISSVNVEDGFMATIRSSTSLTNKYLYGAGIAYANYNLIDEVVMNGAINISADISKISNRNAGGIVYSNYALILNSNFGGKLAAWNMGGIAVQNIYLRSGNPISVEVTKILNTGKNTTTYIGANIMGCVSNGTYILAYGTTEQGVRIAGITAVNNGGRLLRNISKLNNCYTKVTGINENTNLDVSKESKNFTLSGFGSTNTVFSYVGGSVAQAYNVNQNGTAVYSSIENSYSELCCQIIETNKQTRVGAIVGTYIFTSGVSVDYKISGNVHYSTWTDNPINAISATANGVGTNLLNSASEVSGFITSLNSNANFEQVRKFTYTANTLNLE